MTLGDGEARAGRGNMALLARAVRERWPITEDIRQAAVNQMLVVLLKKETDTRNKIAATKVLAAMDSINARREATEARADAPSITVQGNAVIQLDKLTLDERRELLRLRRLLEGGGDDASGPAEQSGAGSVDSPGVAGGLPAPGLAGDRAELPPDLGAAP